MHKNKVFFLPTFLGFLLESEYSSNEKEKVNIPARSLWLCGRSVSLTCVWHVSDIGYSLNGVDSNDRTFGKSHLTI